MPDSSHPSVFVYGTLLVPKIWNAVTHCPELVSKPASLAGHRIARVEEGSFPVIAEDPEAPTPIPGKVYFSVPPEALQRLDAYEDGFYEREQVVVQCEGNEIAAEVYRVPPHLADQLFSNSPWTLKWFEENALDEYWEYHFGG